MSDKNYDQREELYPEPEVWECPSCKAQFNGSGCGMCQLCNAYAGMQVWLMPAKNQPSDAMPSQEPRTDSTDKDAQISEQIRVNRKLREQLAEALYVLELIARRYKYALDEETHDHIQRQLNANPATA